MMAIAKDQYDPRIAFDDVSYDVMGARPTTDDAGARVHRRLRATRLRPNPSVEVLGYDLTPWTFATPSGGQEILGEGQVRGLRLYESLVRKFRRAMPPPRAVRVDGEESYRDFRDARRAPYIAEIASRLGVLERQVADHVSDNHGERLRRLEEAFQRHLAECGDARAALLGCASLGGARIGLDLSPRARRRAVAWSDGPEVLVTICVVSPAGERLFATSGAQAADHFDEVSEAAEAARVPLDALDDDAVSRAVAESVLVGLAQAADDLRHCAPPFVGALDFGRPEEAAAMSLLQHVQRGSRRARAEVAALWHSGGEQMLREVGDALLRAQRGRVSR